MAQKAVRKKKLPPVRSSVAEAYNDFAVVYENTQTQIAVLAENIQTLDEKMERGFADMRREMVGIDKRLMRVEVTVMGLEEDMKEVKEEVKLIRKEMKSDITAEKYNELKRRVEILEEKVGVK